MNENSRNKQMLGIIIQDSSEEPELKIKSRKHTKRQAQTITEEEIKEKSDEDSKKSPNDEERDNVDEAPSNALELPVPVITDGALDTEDRMVATDQIFQLDRRRNDQVSPVDPTASQDFQSISQDRDGPGGK